MKDGADILTLMLNDPECFDDEDVIDEVLDLMIAGTQTTQNTTIYALAHFMTDPESLRRAREEFDSIDGETLFDKLRFENIADLNYLGNCISESLRMNPPVTGTSMYWFDKDTRLTKNFAVKAYDYIFVNHLGLHYNADQW